MCVRCALLPLLLPLQDNATGLREYAATINTAKILDEAADTTEETQDAAAAAAGR